MTSRTIFETKYNTETINLTFDFISELAIGETLSGPVVTPTVYSGTDASPNAILSGGASVSGTIVTQKVTAGTIGVTYTLTCSVQTSAGQVLTQTAYLSVEQV